MCSVGGSKFQSAQCIIDNLTLQSNVHYRFWQEIILIPTFGKCAIMTNMSQK